jgi:hypothetical protein
MASPNLNSPTKVEGKNAKMAVGTSSATVLANADGSNSTLRVVSLFFANTDGTSAADVTAVVHDGTTSYHLCKTVSVPADSTVEIVSGKPVYLAEGDSLRLSASAAGDIEAIVSYEKIT